MIVGDVGDESLILAMNECRKPVLSLDVPSGFLASTGRASRYCVKARSTLAVGLPSVGLYGPEAAAWVGELYSPMPASPPARGRMRG